MKKVISTLLVILLLFTIMPFTEIDSFAATSGDFSYDILSKTEKTCSLTKYTGNAVDVIVPNSIDGYKITSISNYAFSWNKTTQNITLPYTLNSISGSAFYYCEALENIYISESNPNFLSVDGILFNKDKTKLIKYPDERKDTNYIIPTGVKTIGENAFYDCVWLESVDIPKGVTHINNSAFYDCSRLKSIKLPSTVTNMNSISIPKNIISIGQYAFNRGSSTQNDVMVYYNGTYDEWNKKGISNIGSETIRFLSGDYWYSVENNICITIKGYDGSEKNLSIPSQIEGLKVTKIDEYAFRMDEAFESVTIPGNISRIVYNSFRYNDWIKYGNTAVPIKKIYGCSESAAEDFAKRNNIPFFSIGVSNDKFGYTVKEDNSIRIFDYYGTAENLTIPQTIDGYTVTEIAYNTFEKNHNFKTLYIPESINKIEFMDVFDDCVNLESITVSKNNQNYSSENGVLFNKDKTEILYYPCAKGDSDYFIPNGVTTISGYAFYENAKLNKVVISDSVTDISSTAFQNCTGIETLVMGKNAVIGDETFKGCNKITYLTVGNNNQINTLKKKRINEILHIKELNIGNSVNNIDVSYYNNDFENLININVASNNENYASIDGVLFNKSKTQLLLYPRGKQATSYTIPSSG